MAFDIKMLGFSWIEVEDDYITNQPLIMVGKGKSRKRIPNPETEPTEAYMICYNCRKLKTKIKRSRFMMPLAGGNAAELNEEIHKYVTQKNVFLIETIDNSGKYINDGLPPTIVIIEGSTT